MLKTILMTLVAVVLVVLTRVPPDKMRMWANALKVDAAEFAKNLLACYDPHTFDVLFNLRKGKT